MAKRAIGTDESRDIDWVGMQIRMDKARELLPGKWYTLYEYSPDKTKAVAYNRKLIKHHPNIAEFEDRMGKVESYNYAMLGQMLETPPHGCEVISEKEAKRRAERE